LFQPNRDYAEMFFANIFSFASRRRLAEHAYQKTRKELFDRRHELGPVLARHGIAIRLDVLGDSSRHLVTRHGRHDWPRVPLQARTAIDRLGRSLDDIERWLAQRAETRAAAA
jgi:hypothetical protein